MDTNTVFLLAAIGLYFLAMIAIGLYASRKNTDLDDYMLAGRDMKPVSYTHLTLPTTPYV